VAPARSRRRFAASASSCWPYATPRLNPHRPDQRLLDIQAATGASEGVASDGGFAVQHDFSGELLQNVHQASVLAAKARKVPISANANGLKINGVDETSRATGSRWGGVQAYWTAEAGTLTGSKPKYRQIAMELNKLTALYYATDELIQDAAALGSAAGQAFTEEFAFKIDDAMLRGTGAGMPLGVIGHAGTVSIAKETNQPAATVMKANLEKMYARHMSPGNAEWYINQDVWTALFGLTAEVGVGGVPVFLPPGGLSAAPFGMILGRPIHRSSSAKRSARSATSSSATSRST
jgi:HK97 family phage major capsid protein